VSPSFAGFRFPPEVVLLVVRWYLRYGLSYRDVEELLAERGIEVDHVHHLPVGATVHTAGHRGGAAVPAQRR
jgi:transposase-like protein